ncbi:hypothetical protein BCR39DRAFT_524170 [Naematelia encephala]|uniref:Uncharacterized protein n=1 Tax=Naematelia encephala TaxID=71784 RepID=A0A1Y2BBH7_9TREE|nr:hypothetical protein BCR39DRAFT_524170 [Naematelia encephala]
MSSTPRRLASLLSRLPSNGLHAIVRPHNAPSDAFYIITRSRLTFKPSPIALSPKSPSTQSSSSSSTQRVKKAVKSQDQDQEHVDVVEESSEAGPAWPEIGRLKANGKIWALPFYNGTYSAPQRKTRSPSPQIPRSLMRIGWVQVDPSTLPEAVQQNISNWKQTLQEQNEIRDQVVLQVQEKTRLARQETEDKWARFKEFKINKRQAEKTVTVLY